MKILIQDIQIYPFDNDKHKILSIGGEPIPDLPNGIYVQDVPYYEGGHRKSDVYWDTFEQLVKEWESSEMLENYRYQVKLDMEKKSIEYTARLQYRINYYNNKLDRGDTLTTPQQNDLNSKRDSSILAKEYIHNRIVAIDSAIDKNGIDIEYNDFLDKYNKKMCELENIL